jgi:hypothetical protein
MTSHGPAVSPAGLTTLTPAPPGRGFFEIGEELALARTQDGLLTAVVVAGRDGAALETATFSAPPPAAPPSARGTPASTTPSPGTPGTSGRTAPGAATTRAANARPRGIATTVAWLAAAALGCAAAVGALVLRRRRPGTARHRLPNNHRRR